MTGNLQQEGICTAEWDTHVLAHSNHECGVSEIVNKIERTNSTAGELNQEVHGPQQRHACQQGGIYHAVYRFFMRTEPFRHHSLPSSGFSIGTWTIFQIGRAHV